jgi:hypothetical protein
MLLFVVLLLGHPAVILFHALRWSFEGYVEAAMPELLRDVPSESGWTQMEVSFPEGALPMRSRRLALTGTDEPEFWIRWSVTVIVSVVLFYSCAFCYRCYIVDFREPWRGLPDPDLGLQGSQHVKAGAWRYPLFCTCVDFDYCLYGWCCLGSRLGDTYTMTNVGPGFMTYVHAFVAVWLAGELIGHTMNLLLAATEVEAIRPLSWSGFYVAEIALAAWLAGQRRKLRRVLGDPAPDTHWAYDFCCYWWCPCCTAIQEGMQVDEIMNTSTACCFELIRFSAEREAPAASVIGQPVEFMFSRRHRRGLPGVVFLGEETKLQQRSSITVVPAPDPTLQPEGPSGDHGGAQRASATSIQSIQSLA